MGIEQLLWFMFVFILIIVMAYYVSRYYASFTFYANKTKYIKVIDKYVLGRDKYILLIQIDKLFYLVGITNNNITLISVINSLEDYLENKDAMGTSRPTGAMDSFREILNSKIHKK